MLYNVTHAETFYPQSNMIGTITLEKPFRAKTGNIVHNVHAASVFIKMNG